MASGAIPTGMAECGGAHMHRRALRARDQQIVVAPQGNGQ